MKSKTGAPLLSDISMVICTRNCLPLVQANLPAIQKTLAGCELLIIDGDSTDGTTQFVAQYADKVLSDGRKGLAYARQLGAMSATRRFVLFAGTDNRISAGTAAAMAAALSADPMLAGVSVQTRVIDAQNYWEKTTERIFNHLINRVGDTDVIGTPSMYQREALLRVKFNEAIRACDDTDLGYRLKKEGYRLAIIDEYAEEKNALDFAEFWDRWMGYGRSDAEFYAAHHASWGFWRHLKSFTHPLRKYGLRGAWLFLTHGDAAYIPALWIATAARYRGWIRSARRGYFGRFTDNIS